MATDKKKNSGRAWTNEHASVNKKNNSRSKSNKYSASDRSKREDNAEQFWRAGYTRKMEPKSRDTMSTKRFP